MRYSMDTQRKQKTSYEGWPVKNRVEPEGMQGVLSVLAASKNGRNGGNEYTGSLIQRYSKYAHPDEPPYARPACTVV